MNMKLLASFELLVSNYQIAVSDTTLERPCNDWRREHVRQGFSWRARSVSFRTLDILNALVEVRLSAALSLRKDSKRTIRVPFSVLPDAQLEVAVVGDERRVNVPPGEYALTFEHGLKESGESMWCVFTFVPDDAAEPAILIADPELSPPTPLLMEADPV
jgi:hypothetical protein